MKLISTSIGVYKWSDRSMEIQLSALYFNLNYDKHTDRPTDQPTDRQKDGQTGSSGSYTSNKASFGTTFCSVFQGWTLFKRQQMFFFDAKVSPILSSSFTLRPSLKVNSSLHPALTSSHLCLFPRLFIICLKGPSRAYLM